MTLWQVKTRNETVARSISTNSSSLRVLYKQPLSSHQSIKQTNKQISTMRIVVQRICFMAAALLGAAAVAAEHDRSDNASILDDDMKARRRKLALQHSAEPSEKDIATLERLLSRQVFRIEDNNVENSINKRSPSAPSGNVQSNNSNSNSNNPLSRAFQKSLTRGSSSSSNNKNTRGQHGRRTAISGVGRNGGSFLGGSKQFSDIELPTAAAEAEEPVAIVVQEEREVSDTELIAEDTSSVTGAGEQQTEVHVDTTRKGSSKNGHKAGKSSHYDDDIYYDDHVAELIPMKLEAFQDSRNLASPVLNGPLASDLEPGTQYMYSNEPLYPVFLDAPLGDSIRNNDGYIVDDSVAIASVSGKCTRLDPAVEEYTGRAYCQYDYHFFDEVGQEEAEITAEGIVQIGEYSTLSITGGSGIFRRSVGSVLLYTGDIGFESPPVFIPNDSIDLPSSYLVEMYLWLDSLVLPGEGVY